MVSSPLAINLSFVGRKPTGLANYAIHLIPELHIPGTILFAPSAFQTYHPALTLPMHPISDQLTAEQGKQGHLRRLLWTQVRSPHLCAQFGANLFFSPIPEAPLFWRGRSIVTMHDLIPLRFPSRTSPLTYYCRYYVPAVLSQACQILCNSTATATDAMEFFDIPADRLTVIPLAFDAHHFRVPEASVEEPIERPYFFFIGRPDPHKNLDRLIRAFAALPDRNHDLCLAGAMDPRYTPPLQTLASELGVGDRVRFLDYVSYADLPGWLHRATAMVYPSLWEGFGFPVLEAMACGTPVITSNLASLPEVAGDAALLVDPYCEAAIAAALQQLATDATARQQLRQAGLARARQFSWQQTAQATRDILLAFL